MTYSLTESAAEFYETTFVPALFAPWAARLAAVVSPGDRVLDVACGTGAVARAAAGRGAQVTGIDRNGAMLTVARRLRPDLTWRTATAESLPFPDGAFDWALSQAALMFFDDRVAALREMARVAGRVGLQVPGRLSHSPGYVALADVVAEHAGRSARDLVASYFAVGEPIVLRQLCADAGLHVETAETWMSATRLPDIDTFLDAELLPLANEPSRPAIVAAARTALAPFVAADSSIAAPIEVHLVTAVAAQRR
ncbi:MAG TPA: class I SAM-dependent methyltransferase [Actinoplanes sp.]|nr:class I SAM-dependent methyltransferase [Actinoplanes sp.]